jgi:hypothetical protein
MATDAISAELNSYLGRKAGVTSSVSGIQSHFDSGAAVMPVSEQQVVSAVQNLQSHFASRSAPPELRVDYLSGLSIVTVRAAETGELLYQMPGSDAVRLARLIAEGAPVSQGVLDTSV